MEAREEQLRRNMVEQRGKPNLLIPTSYLPYAFETIDTLIRR
jgi:hypothetical protein